MAEQRAILSRRLEGPRTSDDHERERRIAAEVGLRVRWPLRWGTLVDGDFPALTAAATLGSRVKLLPFPHRLDLGAYTIDVRKPPRLPDGWRFRPSEAATCRHHLVQLIAPPEAEWIARIRELGCEVMEQIARQALYVVGDPRRVEEARQLPFVAWAGLFEPAYRLAPTIVGRRGLLRVLLSLLPDERPERVLQVLRDQQAKAGPYRLPRRAAAGRYASMVAWIDAERAIALAHLPEVRWISPAPPRAERDGEREAQIAAGNVDPQGAPIPGYASWLAGLQVDGSGVTIAVCDTGIDANSGNGGLDDLGHVDLRDRQVAFLDYSGGTSAADTEGHGTHVAGIALGSGGSGLGEGSAGGGFLWGQGIAPGARYLNQNALMGSWPPDDWGRLTGDAATWGAEVMNNSWSDGDLPDAGYTPSTRRFDELAREPRDGEGSSAPLVLVFSAGNHGGLPGSLTPPHEAKSPIVVGASLTVRPHSGFPIDSARAIAGASSRGPTRDGRLGPTVVAPGVDVPSAASQFAAAPIGAPAEGGSGLSSLTPPDRRYVFASGTSMAAPQAAGAAALLIASWRRTRAGAGPSPAMVKALLVNTAEDLGGGLVLRQVNRRVADQEAWFPVASTGSAAMAGVYERPLRGPVPEALIEQDVDEDRRLVQVGSVEEVAAAPGRWCFDTGPQRLIVRLHADISPGAPTAPALQLLDQRRLEPIPNGDQGWGRIHLGNLLRDPPGPAPGARLRFDQERPFTASGEEQRFQVTVVDPARPLRITLAWTDAPGAIGAGPALVNDLDLEVRSVDSGAIYRGNRFAGGFAEPVSAESAESAFDALNTVECVYVQTPAGSYDVRVIAAAVSGDARPPFSPGTPWQDFALVIDNVRPAAATAPPTDSTTPPSPGAAPSGEVARPISAPAGPAEEAVQPAIEVNSPSTPSAPRPGRAEAPNQTPGQDDPGRIAMIDATSSEKPRICIDRLTPLDEARRRKRYEEFLKSGAPRPPDRGPQDMALETAKKWPNGTTLRCRFLDGTAVTTSRVEAIAHRWSEFANVQFQFVTAGAADIRISFLGVGSWSYIGTDARQIFDQSQPTMNYGWLDDSTDDGEYLRVVMHEFGHALGCIHEHQHPEAGIAWNREAVYIDYAGSPNYWSREKVDANIFFRYGASMTQFSQFDTASIMMYPVPASHTTNGLSIRGGDDLSATDRSFIGVAYPKPTILRPDPTTTVTRLELNAPSLTAAIAPAGEEDHYDFELPTQTRFVLETRGTTDVMLFLYDSAGNLLAEDDDSGAGTNPRLRRTLPAGAYSARVRHYSSTGTGSYRIRLYTVS